jgi:RNA polymerase subunit RPABC4/transcription elongation factor Spt4
MFCIKCGKELPDESLFCQYCGQKTGSPQNEAPVLITAEKQVNLITPVNNLPPIAEMKMKPTSDEVYCRSCGNIIRKEAEMCPKCGVNRTKPIVSDEVYCYSCGEKIKNAAEICPHCGVRQVKPGQAPAVESGAQAQTAASGGMKVLRVFSIISFVWYIVWFAVAVANGMDIDMWNGLMFFTFGYAITHGIIAIAQGRKHKQPVLTIMGILGLVLYVLSFLVCVNSNDGYGYPNEDALIWYFIGAGYAVAFGIVALVQSFKKKVA